MNAYETIGPLRMVMWFGPNERIFSREISGEFEGKFRLAHPQYNRLRLARKLIAPGNQAGHLPRAVHCLARAGQATRPSRALGEG